LPIVLLVDDPAPLVNIYWWHAKGRDMPRHPDGRPVAKEIPLGFLESFADLVSEWGVRGKFSVLPYPAGLGPITEGWPGCDLKALDKWVESVRGRIMPQMDISPEILTHSRALELETFELLPQRENDWSAHQTAPSLTSYISYALELLAEAGLKATGVTSPWDFGVHVEREYQEAILEALRRVGNVRRPWYFLHVDSKGRDMASRVVRRRRNRYLVSISSMTGDHLWQTMETQNSDDEYIRRVADSLLTEDGEGGRLAELFQVSTPIVFLTHWQSLFCDGRKTGLSVLAEVLRRIEGIWGKAVEWRKCSEFASEIIEGRFESGRPVKVS